MPILNRAGGSVTGAYFYAEKLLTNEALVQSLLNSGGMKRTERFQVSPIRLGNAADSTARCDPEQDHKVRLLRNSATADTY